jgi:hypothetical protein
VVRKGRFKGDEHAPIVEALFAREFTKALAFADRARSRFPNDLMIESYRAHALMFLERGEESNRRNRARNALGQFFGFSLHGGSGVTDVLHRFGEPLLRCTEFVGPVLNFVRLQEADAGSVLRAFVCEIVWHVALSKIKVQRDLIRRAPSHGQTGYFSEYSDRI